MLQEKILKYLYEINTRCDYKLEEVADDILCIVKNEIALFGDSYLEQGAYREAELAEYISKVI